jgi:hypothetical protein
MAALVLAQISQALRFHMAVAVAVAVIQLLEEQVEQVAVVMVELSLATPQGLLAQQIGAAVVVVVHITLVILVKPLVVMVEAALLF